MDTKTLKTTSIVISTSEIIQPRFFVIDVAAIPEGIDRTQRAGECTSLADRLAPCIVSIGYHVGAVAVKQANDVILLVVEVSVGSTIERHHSRLVLCIVEEVQFIRAGSHMHNILPMQAAARCSRHAALS